SPSLVSSLSLEDSSAAPRKINRSQSAMIDPRVIAPSSNEAIYEGTLTLAPSRPFFTGSPHPSEDIMRDSMYARAAGWSCSQHTSNADSHPAPLADICLPDRTSCITHHMSCDTCHTSLHFRSACRILPNVWHVVGASSAAPLYEFVCASKNSFSFSLSVHTMPVQCHCLSGTEMTLEGGASDPHQWAGMTPTLSTDHRGRWSTSGPEGRAQALAAAVAIEMGDEQRREAVALK
ncbi:hypothetical protein P4O66_020318, partial [Electrophorus voltai]